ncbi:MAG: ABC transporter ATP-binding protein [Chloroflexi bacterium]|nr:ABC transporter ATP-binding protein [Chloroflexota bacterium]
MDASIQTFDLDKSFGAIHAVQDVNIKINRGEIYGLLGPNGSGKTTLIRMLVGLIKPTRGYVSMLGARMPNKRVLGRIGYMTQTTAVYNDLSVQENLEFFGALLGGVKKARVQELMELVELRERAHSLASTLSGGMKQRTSLACALVHRPDLLFLDEPTVGVDPQLRRTFWQYFRSLASEGVTIVVSSHVMDEAERCDRLGFIRAGKLFAEGSADELRARAGTANLEDAFLKFAMEETA